MTATQQLIAEKKCTMCTNPLELHDQILCSNCWKEFNEREEPVEDEPQALQFAKQYANYMVPIVKEASDEEEFQRELRCTD